MKLIYTISLLFSIVLLGMATPLADNFYSKKLSYQSIFNQIIATPEKAIILADSAENLGIIPEYKAHIIRSRAYARLKKREESAGIRSSHIPHRFRTKRLSMDKNRFSRMIQSNTGDNYTNYIGNLRMEHSIQLMKQYP